MDDLPRQFKVVRTDRELMPRVDARLRGQPLSVASTDARLRAQTRGVRFVDAR